MSRSAARLRALVAVALITCAAPAAAVEKLQLAVEDAAAPWSNPDGTGFADDVVVAAFRAAGVEVELLVLPYERCKRMVVQGDVAGCFSMSWSPDFEATVAFPSAPLFTCTTQYYERSARPVTVGRQDDLPRGTVVAAARQYEYPAAFRDLERRGTIVVEESSSEELALQRLAAGRVTLALANVDPLFKTSEALLRKAGVAGAVRPVFQAGFLSSYIGFSKRHPRGPWALARFEEGLRRAQASGEVGRIQGLWSARATLENARRVSAP